MRVAHACFVIVVIASPLGCNRSSDFEDVQQEINTLRTELEELQFDFDSAKLNAEKDLTEAKTEQAKAEAEAEAAKAELSRTQVALEFIRGEDLPPLSQPDPEWSPRELLDAYFNAPSWYHRVPLVKDSERVKPLMAARYKSSRIKPMEYEVLQLSPETVEVGGTLTATVKLATHTSEYVICRLPEGFRIDWETSKAGWDAAEEANFRKAHGLVNASIDVGLVKQDDASFYSKFTFALSNLSDAKIKTALLDVTVFGDKEVFLGKMVLYFHNIPPGETRFADSLITGVKSPNVVQWKADISSIEIQTSGREGLSVGDYFQLKQPHAD